MPCARGSTTRDPYEPFTLNTGTSAPQRKQPSVNYEYILKFSLKRTFNDQAQPTKTASRFWVGWSAWLAPKFPRLALKKLGGSTYHKTFLAFVFTNFL